MTDEKNDSPLATEPAAAQLPSAEPAPASGLDIAGFVLAIVVPIVGLILSIVGSVQDKNAHGRANIFAKAGVIVASALVVVQVVATIVVAVSLNNAAQARAYAPVCAAIASHPDLFESSGPASMYSLMYTSDATPAEKQQTWNDHLDQITQWHSEVQDILSTVPGADFGNTGGFDGGYLYSSLVQEEVVLNPETGWNGPVPVTNGSLDTEKEWDFVGLNVQNVQEWAHSNCPSQ